MLLELRRIATDLADLFTQEGTRKPFSIWNPAQRAALASFEVIKKNAAGRDDETDMVHKVKFWNKTHSGERQSVKPS